MTEFLTRLNRGQAIIASLVIIAENMEKSQPADFNEDTNNESASVAVATYTCESWTVRKNEETCLDAFEMKGLTKVFRISWTAKKTNEWVLNKAGVKRELLDTIKAKKLAYYGHSMRKRGSCLEKEIMQGTSQVHTGEEGHTWPGWTTSRRPQDCPWKSQSE